MRLSRRSSKSEGGNSCPSKKIGGRRECRALAAPAALCAERVGGTQAVVTTGWPKSHGIPCAMVLRLLRDLPGVSGLLASVPRAFDPGLTPASRGQDHTA